MNFNEDYWKWLLPYLVDFWWYVQNVEEPPRRKRVEYPEPIEVDLLYSSEALIM